MDNTSEKIRKMVFRWQKDIEAEVYNKAGSEMVEKSFNEYSKLETGIGLTRNNLQESTKSDINDLKRKKNKNRVK